MNAFANGVFEIAPRRAKPRRARESFKVHRESVKGRGGGGGGGSATATAGKESAVTSRAHRRSVAHKSRVNFLKSTCGRGCTGKRAINLAARSPSRGKNAVRNARARVRDADFNLFANYGGTRRRRAKVRHSRIQCTRDDRSRIP